MREGAGVHHVDHRIGMPIISVEEEGVPAGMEISIGDCEDLDFVALFGIDLTEEFPVIWLRLRQAINKGAKVLFFGHFAPEFSRYLSKVTLHAPGQELEILKQHLPQVASLAEGKKGAFFVGRQYLANAQRKPILEELVKLKREMPHLSLNVLEGRGNSLGARLAGMHPELRPLGRRSEHPGLNALQVAERASQDGWDFLYIAGSNPAAQLPSKLWKEMRSKLGCLVVQDVFLTETAQQADVVLPTLCFVEKAGSFINIEQRIQKLSPGKEIPDGVYGDAEIFALLAHRLDLSFFIDKEFQDALKMERLPFVRTEKLQILSHEIRMEMKEGTLGASFAPILFDHGVRMQHNSKLVQLTERPWVRLHPHEGIKRKIQDQEKVYLKTHQNTIKAEIKWDEEVALGTLVLPLGFEQLPVHELSANLLNGLGIEIEACHTSKGG
jgi:NADH-quinone oxidoreductase subunit G